MNEKNMYELLASHGISIYILRVGILDIVYIHNNKTTVEWREDVSGFVEEINTQNKLEGYSDFTIYNELICKLRAAGYVEVQHVAADVFEGRIVVHSASIDDAPVHKDQSDGFAGHHGWESKGVQSL